MRLYHDVRVVDLSKAREVTVTVDKGVVQITVTFDPIHFEAFITKVENVDDKVMEQYLLSEIAEQWERNVAVELDQLIEIVKKRIESSKK
ncbi:hypothetical protein J7J18_04885 [bacterium]|nr:hypothetical protein [bacterium]